MENILEVAGIQGTLAKTYLTLLAVAEITPAKLSIQIKESRTNTYKLLDELVDRGLATRKDINKKLHYRAENPSKLLTVAREIRDRADLQEAQLKAAIPELVKQFHLNHEQPGVRFYQGKEGIKEIFEEQIREAKPIRFMKTRADIEFFGFKFMHEVRNLAPKAKIQRQAFTPDAPEVPQNVAESDKEMLLERTWYLPSDYTAPVEWSVFGNKVAIISFGDEAVGTVIESEQIAESLRQIFALIDEGLKRRPGYKKLPLRGEFEDSESFIAKYSNTIPRINH